MIKLDAMENPYTWPEELRREWLELLAGVAVNRYPDPQAHALNERLRSAMQIPARSGTDPGQRFRRADPDAGDDRRRSRIGSVLSVDPGFVMYRMIATFCGMQYVGVPLNAEDFSLDNRAPAGGHRAAAAGPDLSRLPQQPHRQSVSGGGACCRCSRRRRGWW